MHKWIGVVLFCVAIVSAPGQTPSPRYQPGTIMAVTRHQSPEQHDGTVTQYDVSLKVGGMTYVVLYTPLNGANTVMYALGDELLVLPGNKTVAINTPSGKVEAPILRQEAVPAQTADPPLALSQDFNVKLALSDAQQAEIRPLLEHEAGQVGQLCANPELSRADKLSQYGNIVRASDEQIKPLLSASQVQKLRELRKEQKQDLKRMIADQKRAKQD